MFMVISEHLLRERGRRIEKRYGWRQVLNQLRSNEKVVAVMPIGMGRYGIILERAPEYYDMLKKQQCRGLYAAGPALLLKQEPYVPYNGP